MTRFVLILAILLGASSLGHAADTPDAVESIVKSIKGRLTKAQSYTAQMRIKATIPFLEAAPSTATLYYKAPDRMQVKADGFSIFPKQGAGMQLQTLLSTPHVTVDAGRESFHGVTMRKIKVLPTDEHASIVVATLWVDTTTMLVRKIATTTKNGGTVTAELVYENQSARSYALPSYAKFILNVQPFDLPASMTGEFEKKKPDQPGKSISAVIEVWYSEYRFNVPIPNSVFTD